MEFLIWLIVAVLAGAILHNIDLKFGTGMYRGWYNTTHKEKATDSMVKGFIVGRMISGRLMFALLLLVGLVVLAALLGTPVLAAIGIALLCLPGLVAGFYLGPALSKVWHKKDQALDYLDKVEQGKVDLKKDLTEGARSLGKGVAKATFNMYTDNEKIPEKEKVPVKSEPIKPSEPAVPKLTDEQRAAEAKKMMDKFTKN